MRRARDRGGPGWTVAREWHAPDTCRRALVFLVASKGWGVPTPTFQAWLRK
jgi:hypothetical protein